MTNRKGILTCLRGSRLMRKNPQRKDLQKKILPRWQSALKWCLREVQPGSNLLVAQLIAFTCAPRADWILSPGAQSLVRPGLNSYHSTSWFDFNLTSFASFSKSDFLSQDLKVSKVLVLYNVPKAGQQRAGIEALLNKKNNKREHWELCTNIFHTNTSSSNCSPKGVKLSRNWKTMRHRNKS